MLMRSALARASAAAFALNERDAKRGSAQHLVIVAAIANRNDGVRSQPGHVSKLGFGLSLHPDDQKLDRQPCKFRLGKPEGIGRDHMNAQARGKVEKRTCHARQQPAVESQCAVVVQNKVRQLERAEAGNVDRDHGE